MYKHITIMQLYTYYVHTINLTLLGPPGALEIWGEWLFAFRELWSTGNYFQGFGEQAHSFEDLGSPAKNIKKLIFTENLSFF